MHHTRATGSIGVRIAQRLLATNFEVIILSRSDTASNLPADVTVRKDDYNSVDFLRAAL
jgi:uncharacterized protein YbjT (DUF2867 family)